MSRTYNPSEIRWATFDELNEGDVVVSPGCGVAIHEHKDRTVSGAGWAGIDGEALRLTKIGDDAISYVIESSGEERTVPRPAEISQTFYRLAVAS